MVMCLSFVSASSALRAASYAVCGSRRGSSGVVQPDLLKLTNEQAEDLICTRLAFAANALQELKDFNEVFHVSVQHYEDLYMLIHKRFPAGYSRVSSLSHPLALSIDERDEIYAHYDDCVRRRAFYRSQTTDLAPIPDHDDDRLFLDYVMMCYKQLLGLEEEFAEIQRRISQLHRNYSLLLPPLLH